MDGYLYKEIGEMLGISDGMFKFNLVRVRGILKIKVESYKEKL